MSDRYTFAVSAVKRAGEKLLQISENELKIELKDNDIQNIVTNADFEISNFLTQEISKTFPNEIIYSEENSDVNVESGSYWSIDPIDGTSSFSRKIPHFAVVLTYVENGSPQVAAVYNPKTNELFSFESKKGAFLNGKPVKVSKVSEISQAYTFIRIGRDQTKWDWGISSYKFLLENANKTYSFGSSSLDICFVGAGRIEVCMYGTLTTIDIAGALGFVKEAGGMIIDKNGNEITTLSKEKQIIIAINNENILENLKLTLFGSQE